MKNDNNTIASQLNHEEKSDINNRVNLEIAKSHNKMLKLGAYANVISGIIIIFILNNHVNFKFLILWYSAIFGTSIIDIIWARRYQASYIFPDQLKKWRRVFYVIVAAICLSWSSLGIIFLSNDMYIELYTITFLQVVVLGFCFTSITDFVIASISICCLLLPPIIYRLYLAMQSFVITGLDPSLNIAFALNLLILGIFLLAATYFGAKLVRKFFLVSITNVALNQKLENINKVLEQRVKERTIELEKSLELVTYQATHDLLTDLPNQRLLFDFMNLVIEKTQKKKYMFAVVCFGLNEIAKINDGLGHEVGDLVIKEIAKRFQIKFNKPIQYLQETITYTVTLSRKDVFFILIDPILNIDEVESFAKPLFSVLDDPIYTEDKVIKLTASIGVSIFPRNGLDSKTLLMNADAAMLQASQFGGNSLKMYRLEINAGLLRQLDLDSNLHVALQQNEFLLQYQPFVDAQNGEISGAEALVRWAHPSLGRIPPDEFIPLAEANGIIIPLGEWVLRTACSQLKQWHKLGFRNIKVAVNLSAKQFHQQNFINSIFQILKEKNLSPEYIEFELTERIAFNEDVIPVLKEFKNYGLSLSIDDFGTGYSSLTNLNLLDISKIKIDRSFVQDMLGNKGSQTIVTNTITLAKKLNIKVLAEGVETQEQFRFLKENGCDLIQGYYFSQPLNADIFTELLINKRRFTDLL